MAASERKTRIASAKKELQALKAQLQALVSSRSTTNLAKAAASAGVSKEGLPRLHDRKRLFGHYGKVYAMSWAGNSKHMVSASQDGKLMVWNAELQARTTAIHLKSAWVMTCDFETRESNVVAAGGLDNVCTLYSVSAAQAGDDKPLQELAHHDGYLASCKFVGGKGMLTASGDSTCALWDLDRSAPTQVMADHDGDVMALAVSPTAPSVFVSGSCDATAKVWDLRSGRAEHTFTGHESDINTVAFLSSGTAFGTGSDDATAKVWDLRALGPVASFGDEAVLASVISMDFSASGRLLFAGNDNSGCVVWDTLGSTTAPLDTLTCHTNRVSAVQVAPSGQALATASWDTTLIVYA